MKDGGFCEWVNKKFFDPSLGIYWLTVSILVMAVLAGGCSAQFVAGDSEVRKQEVTAPRIGSPATDFTRIDLNGNEFVLSEQLGKTSFMNFWATWCPPCRIEMPDIEAIYQKYKNKDVVVLGIDVLEQEDRVRDYIAAGNFNWTFVIDNTGEISKNY